MIILSEFKPENKIDIRRELSRLASFGANITDAHSCFIFLPYQILNAFIESSLNTNGLDLVLTGYHSLSNDVIPDCRIQEGSGLVGWVSKHNQEIHVSPFERASATLGMYFGEQELKSFVAVPASMPIKDQNDHKSSAVIACDSKKSFAFSHLQIKLLKELALEVSRIIELGLLVRKNYYQENNYQSFTEKSLRLAQALGQNSIEVMRLKPSNLEEIEFSAGTEKSIELIEQVYRLIQQALPPHFPTCKLPNGHIVITFDNSMTTFFKNKIDAICKHVSLKRKFIEFEFSMASQKGKSLSFNLDKLVSETAIRNNYIELQRSAI